MITGASTANLALILVDARNGLVEQTKRHSFIASLLQIKHVIVCVNKMDLVDFKEEIFENIVKDYKEFAQKLTVSDFRFIPISALLGDNVVNRSDDMNWYEGSTLLHTLENIHVGNDRNLIDCRLPVQTVLRPHSKDYHDFRAYAGKISSGTFKVGDGIMVLPSGLHSTIKSIVYNEQNIDLATPPMSVALTLEDDIDITRGDMIVRPNNQPNVTQDIEIMACWMGNQTLHQSKKFILMNNSSECKAIIKEIRYKVDINTLHRIEDDKKIEKNDIARIKLRTTRPLLTDTYQKNKNTGALILIDPDSNQTVAAGMVI